MLSVGGPLDRGPWPAKQPCPDLAGQRPSAERSAPRVREGAVTDPKPTSVPPTPNGSSTTNSGRSPQPRHRLGAGASPSIRSPESCRPLLSVEGRIGDSARDEPSWSVVIAIRLQLFALPVHGRRCDKAPAAPGQVLVDVAQSRQGVHPSALQHVAPPIPKIRLVVKN